LRATAATRSFDADIDEQLIKVKTGHASDAVRSYKRVSEKKLQNLMDVVACKSLKCDTAKAVSSASCSQSQSVSGASVVGWV